MFEKFAIGQQAPKSILEYLQKEQGERAFFSIENGIFIVLDGITKKEILEFKSDFSFILQEYQIPFVVLKYKNMSFDMPIVSGKKLPGNFVHIYTIDLQGYIVKNIRGVGLAEKIVDIINQNIEFQTGIDDMTIWNIVQQQYQKHSPSEMLKGGTRQRFLGR